jgi:ABC-type antimicrobial peptide transport system permease subunit
MILRNLLRRKTRTLLTSLGIGLGVVAIIVLSSMANMLQKGYDSMMAGSKADLVISQPDAFDPNMSVVDESIISEIAVMPEVVSASGMVQSYIQAETTPMFFVFGYPEESFILQRF